MVKIIFDAHFVFTWLESFRKVHSQLCSILLGLEQPTSHMCYGYLGLKGVIGLGYTYNQNGQQNIVNVPKHFDNGLTLYMSHLRGLLA